MGTFKVNEQSSTDKWVESEERLWLTEDDKLVAEGDPKAAVLFAVPGQRVSMEDAEKYGLVKARTRAGDKQSAPAEDKAATPTATKTARRRATKAGG